MIFTIFHSKMFYEQSLSLGENYIEDSGATAIACSMSRLTSLQVDSTVCPAHLHACSYLDVQIFCA
jgi:hypothetical protein